MDKRFDVAPYINTIKLNTFSVIASGRREAAKKAHEELVLDFPGLNVTIDRISREKIVISGTNEYGDIVLFAHVYQYLDEE